MRTRAALFPVLAAGALALAIVLADSSCGSKKPREASRLEPLEGFPREIVARRAARDTFLRSLPAAHGMQPFFVVNTQRRWASGQVVRVAFRGGDLQLRHDIENAAAGWTLSGNIGLDFGYQSSTGNYREWSPGDSAPAAEIRVGFDLNGYWSCVGTESLDTACAPTSQQSLNLGGFEQWRPPDWRAVITHEFGHALGFEHEHQSPQGGCEAEFRWDKEPGYVSTTDSYGQFVPDNSGRRPGIYTVLGGPPNRWERPTVDANLRRLPPSSAFETSAFDPKSVMKYSFPDWMFLNPLTSQCRGPENLDISSLDREGVARLYPRNPADMVALAGRQTHALSAAAKTETIPDPQQFVIRHQLDAVRALVK